MRLDEEEGTSHLETTFATSKKTNKDKQPSKVRLGISQQNVRTKVMENQKERKALRNSTSKAIIKDSKRTFSLKKIAHHMMKTVTMKKKPMREYCLCPRTINKRYQITKKKG